MKIVAYLYIKLGDGGRWEKESIENNILRFGYKETPYEAALSGDWERVQQVWRDRRKDIGAATRDVQQIKAFFEASEETIWITFHAQSLWWCRARHGVMQSENGDGFYRHTLVGWKNVDANNQKLTFDRLSGKLLRTQGFRGTICQVKEKDYLERKLNGVFLPEVEQALQARSGMLASTIPLIQSLSWQDFELLVDLVFSNSGWRRISPLGETQKSVDLVLMLPSTQERASVQIKSATTKKDLADFVATGVQSTGTRMFFVFHTADIDEGDKAIRNLPGVGDRLRVIGPCKLAKMIFDAGLISWLIDKTS